MEHRHDRARRDLERLRDCAGACAALAQLADSKYIARGKKLGRSRHRSERKDG